VSDAERPDAFIQWKGTDACLDLYCTCGAQFHFDGYFAYELTCGNCGQTYALPNTLRIYPVVPSRPLMIIFDEVEVIRDGEFEIPWRGPEFTGAVPGDTIEVYDTVAHSQRGAYVKLVKAVQAGDGTTTLLVANTGTTP
jgi:hypothetical protein